jgi:cation diffusion facilitator family transporter
MHNINADIYSAGGVLLGLTVILLSGGRLAVVDPIVAILVSLVILSSGFRVLKDSVGELMDASLPSAEEKIIEDTILSYNNQLVGFHKLRTRKSGSTRHVDLHLVLPEHATVESAHELCTRLEEELQAKLPNLSVIIHMEPCEKDCQGCHLSCRERQG